MADLASVNHSPDDEDEVSALLEKNAEDIDRLLSKYKYHVLRSAMNHERGKQLCLVRDVKNSDGQKLLTKGTAKSENALRNYIAKLLKHSLEYPIEHYIDVIEPAAAENIHAEMNRIAEALSHNGICDFNNIKEIINQVVASLKTNHTLLNRLAVFKGEYHSGFNESLTIAIIAAAIGQELGYGFEDRVEAFMAGIFHHIGELPLCHMFKQHKIPYEEAKKIKGHPLAGYLIVSSREISPQVKTAVLKHHLFMDGSGYPHGLSLADDDNLARLTNITSSLVTMCSRGRRPLKIALKLLDIYSRLQTRCGDRVMPLYDRAFYEVIMSLNLSSIEGGNSTQNQTIPELQAIHNNYVKLSKINYDLETLIKWMHAHVRENHIPIDVQDDIDALMDYACRMKNLTADTRIPIGTDQLMTSPALVSELIVDLEVINIELGHYTESLDRSVAGLLPFFENTTSMKILKKARHVLNQIRYHLPNRLVDN